MHLFEVSMQLAPIIRHVTGCADMNLVVNSGEAAGQNVFHYHVHLIPRQKNDGFDIPLPFPGSEMPDRTFLDAMAARIIAALRDPARRLGELAAAS
jgi:histidine triad (HIT) family protein